MRAETLPAARRWINDLRMMKRRLLWAGIPPVFSNHSFRATGITEFLANGVSLEIAQLPHHGDSTTTKLYDRRATRLENQETIVTRFRLTKP